jgi:galactokinase
MVLNSYNNISSGINGKATNAEAFKKSIGSGVEGEANLYTYLGNIENGKDFRPGQGDLTLKGMGGVGTFGGSEDHTAIMSCTKGQLKMWEYCPTKHLRTVDVDPNVRFVIAVSGAKAEKTGAAMNEYNDACALAAWSAGCFVLSRAETKDQPMTKDGLVSIFNKTTLYNPNIPNLAEVVRQVKNEKQGTTANEEKKSADSDGSDDNVKATIIDAIKSTESYFKTNLPLLMSDLGLDCGGLKSDRITIDVLITRFEQYYDESEKIVELCCDSFAKNDYNQLSELVDNSHTYTVEKLKNTIPETAWLPRWAREHGNAIASSAFGAGFGGSCWALVNKDDCENFRQNWLNAYEEKFPASQGCGLTREFFVFSPGPGAFAL